MENHVLSLFVALVATTGSLSTAAQTQKAYAIEKDSTLTFYYDNQSESRQGFYYDMPAEKTRPEWAGEDFADPQERIKRVVFDASFADYRPASTYRWFFRCVNLTEIKESQNLNTSETTDMAYMFDGCWALRSIDLTGFNTANVTNMSNMFADCLALQSLDLTSLNTKNVTDMREMFCNDHALKSLNLTGLNTGSVTGMSSMFYHCEALESLDLTGFNTKKVTDMAYMLRGCSNLVTIYCNQNWNEGNVVYSDDMFRDCKKLVGAVPYNANQTDISMANPNSGYFTTKQATSIADVKSDRQAGDGTAYDLSGRRVGDSYQGIVIKNGQKSLQR